MDYWIDKKSDVALKIQTSMKMIAPGNAEPMEMRQTMTKHDLHIDQPIPIPSSPSLLHPMPRRCPSCSEWGCRERT